MGQHQRSDTKSHHYAILALLYTLFPPPTTLLSFALNLVYSPLPPPYVYSAHTTF